MDLKQMEYIVAIAEERSISKAAQRFFLSPSALSQYLKRLEEAEQLPPLFYRKNRELLLTDAGRIYVNGALAILSLSKKLEDSRPQSLFPIRLAVPAYLEYDFVTECLPRFASAFPQMQTEIRVEETTSARKKLLEGKLEAAVLPQQGEGLPSFLASRPLYTDRIVLAASADGEGGAADASGDPDRFPFILPPAGTFWSHLCQSICTEEKLHPSVYCLNGNFRAAAALLQRRPEDKELAAFLPDHVFREWAEKKSGIREIPLQRSYLFHLSFVTLAGESVHRSELDEIYRILLACFKK